MSLITVTLIYKKTIIHGSFTVAFKAMTCYDDNKATIFRQRFMDYKLIDSASIGFAYVFTLL